MKYIVSCLFFVLTLAACTPQPKLILQLSPGYTIGQYQVTYLSIEPDDALAANIPISKVDEINFALFKQDLTAPLLAALGQNRNSQTSVGLTVRVKNVNTPGILSDGTLDADLLLWNPITKERVGFIPIKKNPPTMVSHGGLAGTIGTAIGQVAISGYRKDKFYDEVTKQIIDTLYPTQSSN